jgi:hypothetical protein
MRKLLFAAALSISSVALAQTQPPAEDPNASGTEDAQPSGETVDDPSQATGPQGITQQGTDPNGQATAPPGTNQPPQGSTGSQGIGAQGQGMNTQGQGMNMQGQGATMSAGAMAATPRAAAGEYPPCSRTVTDGCIQTYERGVRSPRRRR